MVSRASFEPEPLEEAAIAQATSQHERSRPRALASLFAATVLLPLALLMIGLWQSVRGGEDWRAFAAERDRLAAIVADLEARSPQDGRPDFRLQFRHDGKNYGGPYAW